MNQVECNGCVRVCWLSIEHNQMKMKLLENLQLKLNSPTTEFLSVAISLCIEHMCTGHTHARTSTMRQNAS